VDLFVSRYVHVEMSDLPQFGNDPRFCRFKGVLVQCGPWGMPGESNLLFHNKGDGTFEEVSKKAGVDNPHHYYGLGATWGDFDNDGWPDLYVANDTGPNFLYHNKHDGTFEDVGLLAGAALSGDGLEQGSMGVDWGDYLHEGRLSMIVTNFIEQGSTLYHNLDGENFADVSVRAKLLRPTYPYVSWGTGFFDMDNDGWLDLFIANGHVYPQADALPDTAPYRQPMLLFRNGRDGTFDDVSEVLANMPPQSRRGAAFGDLNNDGNMDIVVLNVGEPPSLLINRTQSGNHRVLFKLVGTKSNKAAIGARVAVKAGTLVQIDEVRGGASYLSQNDLRLHFGLGANDKMSEVDIRWPNGETEVLHDVPADFIYTVVEGEGIRDKVALPQRHEAARGL
jgi:enediyne biosynthesis protein E4